ncbi:MAG TPA: hypothetical protein VIH91_01270 [Terriglobales bacterium]
MKRAVLLLGTLVPLLIIASCSSNNSVTGPNGNVTVNAPSKLQHRAFITNQYSGNIQIMDSQNDTTAYYTATNNNTGVTGTGVTGSAVAITVSTSLTFAVLSPDDLETLVYDPTSHILTFITNSSETTNGTVNLADYATMALYSPDSKNIYVPVPNALITNSPPGGVQVINVAAGQIIGTFAVPSARYVAISPDGNTLLVFANNADTMWLIHPTASAPSAVAISGFARPVNAFFSSDSSTAYVLNCGPECGSMAGPPSVMSFNVASQTITSTVAVGGASVGLLKGSTLYVAGYPGGATGTFDVVDVSAMTRTTTNSIAIGDGTHTTMALSNNNKMYIGAVTCVNVTNGCLSIVDLGNNQAAPPLPPRGAVTGMQSIPNRNTMYVIEGTVLDIYDTSTGQLQTTQVPFRGALYGVIQVDQ